MIAGHTGSSGYPKSQLYKADKYSWYLASPIWIYLNTFFEPKLAVGLSRWGATKHFKEQVKESIESGKYESNHSFYLQRANGGNGNEV